MRSNREIWWALLAILVVSGAYLLVVYSTGGIPAARSLFGHGIGILGFLLMLMTESLYSLRKLSRKARWGRNSDWLRFHIFTGLVGPYMVLLHSSWKFNGLAGVVMLFTLGIVASGILGRYIYTAVPRTAEGAEMQLSELEEQQSTLTEQVRAWAAAEPEIAASLPGWSLQPAGSPNSARELIFNRSIRSGQERSAWQHILKKASPEMRVQITHLKELQFRRVEINRQINSLAAARRLLGIWKSVHIPIGIALFTAAFVHAAAALYYATFMH
jgi:hypothetical protein